MHKALISPLFLSFIMFMSIYHTIVMATSQWNREIRVSVTVDFVDVTLYDVYKGLVNESHPMYWGQYKYFFTEDPVFFVQKGGVHNHAYAHTVWDSTPHIKSIRNIVFDPVSNMTRVYRNHTIVTFSNGSTVWLQNRICPLCNHTMHAAEFSPNSIALYWFCDEDRFIIGERLE